MVVRDRGTPRGAHNPEDNISDRVPGVRAESEEPEKKREKTPEKTPEMVLENTPEPAEKTKKTVSVESAIDVDHYPAYSTWDEGALAKECDRFGLKDGSHQVMVERLERLWKAVEETKQSSTQAAETVHVKSEDVEVEVGRFTWGHVKTDEPKKKRGRTTWDGKLPMFN